MLGHRPRRTLLWVFLAAALAVGVIVWWLLSPAPKRAPLQTAAVGRGDVVVTVGGLGRIVEANASGLISLPGSSTSSSGATASATGSTAGTGSAGGASVSAGAVLPRASGRISRLLIAPGARVTAGEVVALLDDGGTAAAAVAQARNDVATTSIELLQKRTKDPLKGLPPTPTELAAARFAVISARQKLARVLGPPRPADVRTAEHDVRRAELDIEVLQGGTAEARARAIQIAGRTLQLAQERLARLLQPPSRADVGAAELEIKKAQADLAALLRGDVPASPEALAAARKAIEVAGLKLAKLLEPPAPADVTAANLEVDRAQAELATLQSGPSTAAIFAATAALAAAQARLEQLLGPPLRSDVTAARLDVRKALADLAVLSARGGPGSPTEISIARLKVEAARAKLAAAEFAARQLKVRVVSSGTVTAVLTVPGAPVDATTPIANVADLRHLAVSVALSEFDAARVKRGQRALVSVDALGGKRFRGKVLFEALTGVDTGGVVTFPVRVALEHIAGVKPGMNVSVRIIVANRTNVVRVPLEAVAQGDGQQATVTVVDAAGKTSVRTVTLGLANNKDVEVKNGLEVGERVVLAGGGGA
ncbi:MAG TPA: efflux RND transporter periplasmic adaptor subunit [Gaiellaceae bacterium]